MKYLHNQNQGRDATVYYKLLHSKISSTGMPERRTGGYVC